MKNLVKLVAAVLLTAAAILSSTSNVNAQASQTSNYQAVVRDTAGVPIVSDEVSMIFYVLEGSENGPLVYQETHTDSTDLFGLFNVAFGGGIVDSGYFSTIDWGNEKYFLMVEMAYPAASAYKIMGTTEIRGVPYDLQNGGDGFWGANGDDIYNLNSGNVGVGTDQPMADMEIVGQTLIGDRLLVSCQA
jgi:hypothetical protein